MLSLEYWQSWEFRAHKLALEIDRYDSLVSRTYVIQTLGCQMNVHDSERIAGSLDAAGYIPAADGSTPDLIVFNTCSKRKC